MKDRRRALPPLLTSHQLVHDGVGWRDRNRDDEHWSAYHTVHDPASRLSVRVPQRLGSLERGRAMVLFVLWVFAQRVGER